MTVMEFISMYFKEILWSIGFFLGWLLIAFYFKHVWFVRYRIQSKRRDESSKSEMLQYINTPLNLFIVLTGFLILVKTLPVEKASADIEQYIFFPLEILTVIIAIIMVDQIIKGLMIEYSIKKDFKNLRQSALQGVVRGIVYVIGGLILLDLFGVNISPLIASLGIGTLAVAIALQPTLSNLFSGLSISMDGSIQVGDLIELDQQERGYVIDIGWRASRVKLINENVVVVPNSQLVSSRVTNYDTDSSSMKLYIYCGVHYESDLRKVERVALEVAQSVIDDMDEADKSYNPHLRFREFGESSITFMIIIKSRNFISQFKLQHEMIMRLHERFRQEGIVIPFPLRTLDIQPKHEQLLRELANRPVA